jgi:hypothetical protein
MPILLFIGLMLALLAFIVWERRRPVAPPSRQEMARGLSPLVVVKWRLFAGFSLAFALMATVEWLSPSQPPFSGRWSFLKVAAYTQLGIHGIALVWAGGSVVLLVLAFSAWHSSQRMRSRSDAVR